MTQWIKMLLASPNPTTPVASPEAVDRRREITSTSGSLTFPCHMHTTSLHK